MRLLLLFATALLPALAASTSPPQCPETPNGYQAEKLFFLARVFCNKLSTTSFASYESFTGSATDPWVSFGFEAIGGGSSCTEDICNAEISTLTDSCKLSNHTIFGGGTLGTGCGNYNFTIYAASFRPGEDGSPVATTTMGVSLDGGVQSSIEAVLVSSFSLSGTKRPAGTTSNLAATTTNLVATTTNPIVTSAGRSSESSAVITGAVTTTEPTVGGLSTGVGGLSVAIETAGRFGNGTSVAGSLTMTSQAVGTASGKGQGGSTTTSAAAGVVSTAASSGEILKVGGLELVVVGMVVLLL